MSLPLPYKIEEALTSLRHKADKCRGMAVLAHKEGRGNTGYTMEGFHDGIVLSIGEIRSVLAKDKKEEGDRLVINLKDMIGQGFHTKYVSDSACTSPEKQITLVDLFDKYHGGK